MGAYIRVVEALHNVQYERIRLSCSSVSLAGSVLLFDARYN